MIQAARGMDLARAGRLEREVRVLANSPAGFLDQTYSPTKLILRMTLRDLLIIANPRE
jgi:hypothetical protein